VPKAQQALYHRAKCNQAARRGEYNTELEKQIHDITLYKHQT
jgi:hypothetical protein